MNKFLRSLAQKIHSHDIKTMGKLLLVPTAILNIFLALILFWEYSEVRKKGVQLELYQNDYQEYQRVLKHIIEDYCEQHSTSPEQIAAAKQGPVAQESAEKTSAAQTAEFVPLNRDKKHLERTVFASVLKEAETKVRIKPRLRKRRMALRAAQPKDDGIPSYPLVKNAPFGWPLDRDNFWISSYFGRRRTRSGKIRLHAGIDMAAVRGTLVKAAAPGRVEFAGRAGTFGFMILISHDARYKTRYAHLSRVLVRDGTVVRQGQIIGCVGNTGRVSGKNGDHLHFEVLSYGRAVNPMKFLANL